MVVVGNEKGGAGKSTLAALIAISMLYRGQRVSVIDLDLRQQSLSRLLANRRRWLPAAGVKAPSPLEYKLVEDPARIADDQPLALRLFEEAMVMAMGDSDLIVIDTPGSDTAVSRAAHLQADLIVTPMNDSFVDFDVLGNVDPVTLRLVQASHYAETVLNVRTMRAHNNRRLDWVVLRNRLAGADTNNRERVGLALDSLSEELGFRIGPPLRERVAYREMFPFGLTLADVSAGLRPNKVSSPKLAAREEVNALLEALGLIVLAPRPAPVLRPVEHAAFAASL
ncbi:MAG: division plane positioning ATPase MipZ [Caulobacter sp.]|nr:division plane positioning ATPase MipZ [Caulobacter sp.]